MLIGHSFPKWKCTCFDVGAAPCSVALRAAESFAGALLLLIMAPQRIVGYSGFLPGGQHLHGKTYGDGASTTLMQRATENNSGKYLTASDLRCEHGALSACLRLSALLLCLPVSPSLCGCLCLCVSPCLCLSVSVSLSLSLSLCLSLSVSLSLSLSRARALLVLCMCAALWRR